MRLKKGLKSVAMKFGVYGQARRAYSRFSATEMGHFRRATNFYSNFIGVDDLCFDVGANIGEKTEVFLATQARVVAFEPQPDCFREMSARCGPNRRLIGVNSAVGEKSGFAEMYIDQNRAISSLINSWGDKLEDRLRVPVMTLDDAIVRYGKPKFCKIDVEGFELEVIRGLSQALPWISLEYRLTEEDIAKTINCLEILATRGELLLNVTLGEDVSWQWPEWVPYHDFEKWFPARAPRNEWCSYGDLFVRTLMD